VLSETWLFPCNFISIPQFHFFKSDCIDGYGGIAVVTHRSIQIMPIDISYDLKVSLIDNFINLIDVELLSNCADPIEI